MMKLALLAGFGMLLPLGSPAAEAQDGHRARPHSRRHVTTRVPERIRPEMQYDRRHCDRCVPRSDRQWMNAPRPERIVSGYDNCGNPIYRSVTVPGGYWATRTTYTCR